MTEPKVVRYAEKRVGKLPTTRQGDNHDCDQSTLLQWLRASRREELAARLRAEELAEQLRLANVDCFNTEAENKRLREALEDSPCTCDKTDVCWVKECLRCAALREVTDG